MSQDLFDAMDRICWCERCRRRDSERMDRIIERMRMLDGPLEMGPALWAVKWETWVPEATR